MEENFLGFRPNVKFVKFREEKTKCPIATVQRNFLALISGVRDKEDSGERQNFGSGERQNTKGGGAVDNGKCTQRVRNKAQVLELSDMGRN